MLLLLAAGSRIFSCSGDKILKDVANTASQQVLGNALDVEAIIRIVWRTEHCDVK